MAALSEGRIRLRYTLGFIILATLPCYCMGLVMLRLSPGGDVRTVETAGPIVTQTPTSLSGGETPTESGITVTPIILPLSTATLTATSTHTLTLTPTETGTATQTLTVTTTASVTLTGTATASATATATPTVSPTITKLPSHTFTSIPVSPTATETRRPPDQGTQTPTVTSQTEGG